MRVRIISYENPELWILGKFAKKLTQELLSIGVAADLSNVPDPEADINHHIIYIHYDNCKRNIETLMVTHIDGTGKFLLLRKALENADMAICLSQQTVEELATLGLSREKLCFVNPGHDGLITPRPTIIGITSKLHDDGRKQEGWVLKLLSKINPRDFAFKIMGSGWAEIVDSMRKLQFNVTYFSEFNYDVYKDLVPTFDYYLYTGSDEGSMGFLDAVAAGIPTIVTPQGFHLDVPNGITHPFTNFEELLTIFRHIGDEKAKRTAPVASWTWKNYALKHFKIWSLLLEKGQEPTDLLHRNTLVRGAKLKRLKLIRRLLAGSVRTWGNLIFRRPN